MLLAVAAVRGVVATAQVAPPPAGFAVSKWTTADGLPQSAIASLGLDGEGYLWLATNTGLARFDGDTFVDYPRSGRQQPAEIASQLVPDGAGGFWVLWPQLGLGRLLTGGRSERTRMELPFNPLGLAIGPGDTAWVHGERSVWRRVEGTWAVPPELPDGIVGDVRALRMDAGGVLWLGGTAGLVRSLPGRPRAVQRVRGLACDTVVDVEPTADGGAWVASCAGVERVRPDGRADGLAIDRRGAVWPGRLRVAADTVWLADARGVHRYEVRRAGAGRWHAALAFTDALDMEGALPNAIIPDGLGGVWIATGGAGLRRVRALGVARVTIADGLPARPAHHLAPDGTGGLWIGNCGGLARWRDRRLEVADTRRLGLATVCIKGLLLDRTRGLWIGERDALHRLDSTGRATAHRLTDTQDDDIAPLLEDRRGRVWFGTQRGRVGYVTAGGGAPVLLPADAFPREKIWSMAEDADGAIWIGQTAILTRVEGEAVTRRLTASDGVPAAPLRGLLPDSAGALWIASYGDGLARFTPDRGVMRVPPRGRRFEQLLSSIGRDAAGRFWMHGDGGLTVVPAAALREAVDGAHPVLGAVTMGAGQGVPEGNNGHRNAWLDERSQRVWLATVDGVASVDLSLFPFDRREMQVRIDDLRLDGTSVGVPDSLVVPAGASAVEIWFSSPVPGAPDAKQIRYRLAGHDRDWVQAGAARVARYANLTPGTYVFEVVAQRGGGGGVPVARTLGVVVQPRWWETGPARVLAVLLAGAALWVSFGWGTRRIRARNRALQREIAERERAERQAADAARELAHVSRLATAGELATSIAHELNQPLTAVMGSAQKARRLAGAHDGAALGPTLDAIVDQSERAAQVIRSLRAFVHKQEAPRAMLSLDDVVEDALRLLRQELVGRGVAVEVRDERTWPAPVRGSAVPLQQVLVNLLLNAADAMVPLPAERRRAAIVLRDEGPDHVRLSVADSGPGFPADLLTEIFKPFVTTKEGGLGLGLSLSRSIVEAHGGRLWAENAPEGGGMLHMVLPVTHA